MSIRTRNLQILVTGLFKEKKIGESPSIISEIFLIDDFNNYNLSKNGKSKHGNPKTVYYGTETISVLGPKFKNWVHQNFPCCSKFWLYLISIRNSVFDIFA